MVFDLRASSAAAFRARLGEMLINKKTSTQLAKMNIDQKFVELTTDVLDFLFLFL